MLGTGSLTLTAADAAGGSAALFHIALKAGAAVFPAEHGTGIETGEHGGNIDLHGAAVGAVAAGGTGDEIHAVKNAPHFRNGFVFLSLQRTEVFHKAKVIRHLFLAAHAGEHHHHALLRGGIADGIAGVASALQTVQNGSGLLRQVHQIAALYRLHDDGRLSVSAADLQTGHAPDHRAVRVQIVKLDLYRFNAGLLGEDPVQHLRRVVEGHADMPDLSLGLQLPGNVEGPAVHIFIVPCTAHGVHQVKVKVFHPAGLKLRGKEGADIRFLIKKSEGELVGQYKAFPGVSGDETFSQRCLALAAQIGPGRVKIVEAALHKQICHPRKTGQVDLIFQLRQSHAAEAKIFLDFREKVVHGKNLPVS